MSIELYLAVNLIADFAVLGSVSRALGVFSWRRSLMCAALCAAYAPLAAARPFPWALPVVQATLLAAVSILLTRRAAPRLRRILALSLCAAAMLCGGLAGLTTLSGFKAMAAGVAAGTLLIAMIFAPRPLFAGPCQVSLCLAVGDKTARFPALIDTGNRLREPLSGLPVLIAEAALLRDVLPEGGYRTLAFGGVGGEGRMACFRPGAVWIERGGRRRRAPEVWIAVSPGPLPGLCQALAPPEFAQYGKSYI